MENTNSKSTIQRMYEQIQKNGGPTGKISQAVVDVYEGKQAEPTEQKAVVQLKNLQDNPINNSISNTTKISKRLNIIAYFSF